MNSLAVLPHTPGVYLMRSSTGEIIYVGKAKDLAKRVPQYFSKSRAAGDRKITALVALIRKIDYIPCASERDALVLERDLIGRLQPFFNSMWKDGKSYPYIKISFGEEFPRIGIARRKADDGGSYFGPYPKTSYVRKLLGWLWKSGFLPLRPCKWNFSRKNPLPQKTINACIYFHTKQCPAPCAGRITPAAYRRLARRGEDFLSGKAYRLREDFEKKMKAASSAMDYEEAARYRDLMYAISHMEERVKVSLFRDEELAGAMESSRAARRLGEVLGLARPPEHIEAFDTSSLFGREPVGSMVCFVHGKKHHPHYRRFKIRSVLPEGGSDDFLMIKEIVSRRLLALKREGGPLPDLFLIDGGKGQLAMAAQAEAETGVRIPLVSLAKREEELFVPGRSESIRLPKSDPALRLLMLIRDETHRFGISYHRQLRGRRLLG